MFAKVLSLTVNLSISLVELGEYRRSEHNPLLQIPTQYKLFPKTVNLFIRIIYNRSIELVGVFNTM